ncbi:MAG: flotillin family protein, partial [Prevotella sp.]|nr:flotillin family protein [Prevotella sp.]
MTMDPSLLMIIGAVVAFLVLFFMLSYVKAPPSYAFIISGLSKEPRVLIGSGGFRIPFFERLDKVYLGQI